MEPATGPRFGEVRLAGDGERDPERRPASEVSDAIQPPDADRDIPT